MKKFIIPLALMALLGTVAVSCQKETISDPVSSVEQVCVIRTVRYSVDGVNRTVTLYGEEAWASFVRNMLQLTKEGHVVCFSNENAQSSGISSKETIKFTTKDQAEAETWVANKIDEGYTVTMIYKNGQYICIATREDK